MKIEPLKAASDGRAERRPTGAHARGYAAFISYSHAVDGELAPALQGGLHRFARPSFALRALRVFRDEASLAANPGLWSSIEQALEASQFFILLASPDAARSTWVQREVTYWLQHKSPATFLIVLTSGELVWDEVVGDFDWQRTTALPPAVCDAFREEPRYIDLRWARAEDDVSLHDPRFREAVADLAAPLHHRPKDALLGEDVRQHRRTVRWVRGTIATLTVLLILALSATGIAINRQQAAEERQRLATARLLLTRAELAVTSDPRTALQLAEAAHRINPDPETQSGLAHLLLDTRYAGSLEGHTESVRALTFAPDGRTLATAARDETVILWDMADPNRPHRLGSFPTGRDDDLRAVSFHPDGRTLAATGGAGVQLWDVSEPSRPRPLGDPLTVVDDGADREFGADAVAFAPGGRLLAASSGAQTVLWDVSDPARPVPVGTPPAGHLGNIHLLGFTPDGRTLAAVSDTDRTLIRWDLSDPVRPREMSRTDVARADFFGAVALSTSGTSLVAGDHDAVNFWDLDDPAGPRFSGTPLSGNTSANTTALAFSGDGSALATARSDHTVLLWDLSGPVAAPHMIGGSITGAGEVSVMAFAPDGRSLATASGKDVMLWNVTGRAEPQRLGDPLGVLESSRKAMAFAPRAPLLAVVDNGRRRDRGKGNLHKGWTPSDERNGVVLWDLTDPTRPRRLGDRLTGDARSSPSVAFAPDGRTLAMTGGRTTVLWDVSDPSRPTRLADLPDGTAENAHGATAVSFSPTAPLLAAANDDGTVALWDLRNPSSPRPLGAPIAGSTHSVNTLGFAPDGSILVVAAPGQQTALWEVSDPARPARLGSLDESVGAVAFAPDGRTVATAGAGQSVLLWDVTDPARPRRLGDPLAGHLRSVEAVAFSGDGRTLATAAGSDDRTVLLWDVVDPARPRRLGEPLGLNDGVPALVFAPDGRLVAGSDNQVALWGLTRLEALRNDPIELACSITRDGLDVDQWVRNVPGLDYEDSCTS